MARGVSGSSRKGRRLRLFVTAGRRKVALRHSRLWLAARACSEVPSFVRGLALFASGHAGELGNFWVPPPSSPTPQPKPKKRANKEKRGAACPAEICAALRRPKSSPFRRHSYHSSQQRLRFTRCGGELRSGPRGAQKQEDEEEGGEEGSAQNSGDSSNSM